MLIRQGRINSEHRAVILEQKVLRLQMNPHFIFNALTNIVKFIQENRNNSAIQFLNKFSKLLRTTLESSREDFISLEDEIICLRSYLELQHIRFGNKFDYRITADELVDPENTIIPPMLIQPFVENAIEHGLRHKEGIGHLDVRFSRRDSTILCEIEDDGIGRENAIKIHQDQRKHRSLATFIIRERIDGLNKKLNKKIKLAIIDKKSDSNQALGTIVRLEFPCLESY
jgi:LytS/YehU family sensor histidine kinase